ncbi:hypothetical protein R6Q59_002757 [Mikania micrantha]
MDVYGSQIKENFVHTKHREPIGRPAILLLIVTGGKGTQKKTTSKERTVRHKKQTTTTKLLARERLVYKNKQNNLRRIKGTKHESVSSGSYPSLIKSGQPNLFD